MINPDQPAKKTWDAFIALLTIYAALEIPVRVAFALPISSALLVSEFGLSLFFSLDVVVHFFTAYRDRDRVVTDPGAVVARYLRTWFVLDLIAALPLGVLLPTGANGLQHLGKILRLVELNRLFKLGFLFQSIRRQQKLLMVNPSLLRLATFLFWITLSTHWIACGWVFLGGSVEFSAPVSRYINSLYWTITTLTTVGYGDITPHTDLQKIFTMAVMMTGVASYGFLIGNLAGFLENRDLVQRQHLRKIDEVNSFLLYRHIPRELRERVHHYYGHLWESEVTHDEIQVLGDLPTELRTEIALVMHRHLIQRVPFFRDARPDFIRDIVLLLRPQLLVPATTFIREGSTGHDMYFISHGEVELVSGATGKIFGVLGPGDFVGEMALLLDVPRTATVRTRDYCDVYVLAKADFLKVLDRYPDFKEHIQEIIKHRLKKLKARNNPGR